MRVPVSSSAAPGSLRDWRCTRNSTQASPRVWKWPKSPRSCRVDPAVIQGCKKHVEQEDVCHRCRMARQSCKGLQDVDCQPPRHQSNLDSHTRPLSHPTSAQTLSGLHVQPLKGYERAWVTGQWSHFWEAVSTWAPRRPEGQSDPSSSPPPSQDSGVFARPGMPDSRVADRQG